MSKKIVFFGNEKLATGVPTPKPLIRNAVVSAGFEIEQVLTGKLSELQNHEAELAVLAAYGRIIPGRVLDEFPAGIINVHPSLLPQYRGPTPIEQALLDGAIKTGVSIMRLTAGMDEGPIYKQKILHISSEISKTGLVEQLQRLGAELLVEVLPSIADGSLQPRQQPHPDRATYSHLLTKEDGIIDWQKPAVQLEREIRAFSDWPKSRTMLGNLHVAITKAAVTEIGPTQPGKLVIEKRRLLVGTGENYLEIFEVQPDGKKVMPIEAFLAGYQNQLI